MKTIGANIVLEGEQQYREALKTISGQQRELASEMELTSARFDGQQNSLDALQKRYEILGDQIAKQREKIEVYADALESAKTRQSAAAESVDKYEKELEEARAKLDEMKNSSETTENALSDQADEVERLENMYKLAGLELLESERNTTYWQTSLNKAQAELVGMEGALEKTNDYLDEAKKSTDQNAKSIDEYGNEIEDAEKKTSIFGETLKSSLASEAIAGAIRSLTGAVKNMASAALEVGSQFESSMSQVAATMGMTADEINGGSEAYEMLANAAKQCGETTKYSASEAAEALNYLALAGYDAAKAAETLPKVLNLAAAGGLDLATASDMVTDAMAALGMETSDLDKYIDEMAVTAQKSNTSVAQLGEATLAAAGAVSTAGMDLETMNAELGVLANNGIKGAEGGTHLRNVILSLSAPTDTAAEALHKLGVETVDDAGNMRDLNAILYDLNKSLDGMGSAQKAQYISQIFNKTDISAVNALLKGTSGEFDLLKRQIELSAGAAQNMADTMNNNLKGKITILQSALEGLGISVYEVFDDDVKRGVDAATDAVSRLNDSVKEGDMNVSLNKLADAIGDVIEDATEAAVDVLPKLIDGLTLILDNLDIIIPVAEGVATGFLAFNAATKATEVLNSVIALLPGSLTAAAEGQTALNAAQAVSPMGAVAAAAGLLVTALGILFEKTGNYTPKVYELTKEEQKLVDSMKAVNDAANTHRDAFSQNVEALAANRTQAQELVSKLRELEPQAKNDASAMNEMQKTVDQLNTIMPDLGLSINSVTGELNMGVDAIDAYVDSMMHQIEIDAYSERLTEILRDRVDVQNEMIEMEDAYNEAVGRVNAAFEERDKAAAEYQAAYEAYMSGTAEVSDAQISALLEASQLAAQNATDVAMGTREIRGEYGALEGQLSELDEEYERYQGLLADTAPQEAATEATEALTVEWKGHTIPALEGTSAKLEELSQKYAEAYDAAKNSLQSQMGLFQEFKVEAQSIDSMTSSMSSQAQTMTEYGDNLQKALDLKIDPQIIASIEEMGIQGAGYLAELVSAAEEGGEEMESFMAAWSAYQEALADTSAKMAEFETLYSENMDGIYEKSSETTDAMLEDQSAFSEDYVDSWTTTGEEAATAIEEMEPVISENVTLVAAAAVSSLNTELGIDDTGKSSKGFAAGQNFGRSIANGIEDMEDEIVEAVAKVGRAAVAEAEEWARKVDEALGENL